ncbi:hypothetical protein MYX78_06320 [Acidobacteria bacterium AH-259-G07]|nr:hypothetical protein [Acidobacteria bacterium AH-259-G07]
MPFVLRTIRKARWYKPLWLSPTDIPADPLGDLQTKDNCLSVWKIQEDYSNWDLVITALAANRQYLSNLDYAVFDEKLILEHEIRTQPSRGVTPLVEVNDWHLDLVELSGHKLVSLTKSIMENAKIGRVPEKNIIELLREALKAGQIRADQLRLKEHEKQKL